MLVPSHDERLTFDISMAAAATGNLPPKMLSQAVTSYWMKRDKYMEDIHVDMDVFWLGIAGL